MTRALVTGAAGFIGSALTTQLHQRGWQVRMVGRGVASMGPGLGSDRIECDDLAAAQSRQLDGWMTDVDVVYHLAGRAHRRDRGARRERYERYRRDNVETTKALFAAAQRSRVTRFVYLSSIKVLGDVSAEPLQPQTPPNPHDVYAQTKLEAERALQDAQPRGETLISVVRPPLVYGPGVKGNFASLLRAVARGIPLPLGCATAPRSLIARANLVELLIAAAQDAADWRIVHGRDATDCSVAELVTLLATGFGRSPRLLPVPARLMHIAAVLSRREALYQRLFEPCVVDDAATRAALGWQPVQSQRNALDEVVQWWQSQS